MTLVDDTIRIAMWSGPRNISTALMRSWEARGDTVVCDEPLYAHYLSKTSVDHPGREEIIAACDTDWRMIVNDLTGSVPSGKAIFYQKHMAHHLLSGMMGPWLLRLRNAFLLRDPSEMLLSLSKVMESPTIVDTGLPQQQTLFEYVREKSGEIPAVIDARDVLQEPRSMLEKLCAALDVPFTQKMLSWKPGGRPTDGVWADYWYDSVRSSTGFRPYEPPDEPLPERLQALNDECLPYYQSLYSHRLTP